MRQFPPFETSHARQPPSRWQEIVKGLEKSAVLLISLGPDRAAKVFRHLDEEEIETLSLEVAKLQRTASGVADRVLEEFAAIVRANESLISGGADYARGVLEEALGTDRAAEIMGRLTGAIERRPFEFLSRTPADQIVMFLRNESAQTVALVIANLHATLAAQTLAGLPQGEQAEIARRIAQIGETAPDVVREVEQVMRQRAATFVRQDMPDVGGVKSIAGILTQSGRSTERSVLEAMEKVDEELAAEVRRLLFTFEDIVTLDDRSIQLVLREADQKDLALALRGVSDEVKERVLANMSERGAQMLLEEIEYQPAQKRRVVEDAQGRIVAIVRRLEEADAIVLTRGDEEAVV